MLNCVKNEMMYVITSNVYIGDPLMIKIKIEAHLKDRNLLRWIQITSIDISGVNAEV